MAVYFSHLSDMFECVWRFMTLNWDPTPTVLMPVLGMKQMQPDKTCSSLQVAFCMTYINTNWLFQGFVMQKKIRSKVNSSAYFTALKPAHQISLVLYKPCFASRNPFMFQQFMKLSWLIVQSTAWPFIYSLVNISSRGYKTTYTRLTWGTACSISWLCPSTSNMMSQFLYFHDLFEII